jgi:NitT/TauT family transport system permease protein
MSVVEVTNSVGGAVARWQPRAPWKAVRIIVFYLGLLAIWQVLAWREVWPSYTFPPPADVWESLRERAENGVLWQSAQNTMQRMLIGYTLSIAVGLSVGIALGMGKWVDETVGSVVLGIQSLPSVTWLPLALLWFGLNEKAIIFVVLMGSVGSIAISTRAGVKGIPPILLRASRMFGGNQLQRIFLVVIPGMLPALVQGLKLGWSFAWRSLLAAELLFVSQSLGYQLQVGRDLNDVSLVVGIMLVIVAIGITVDRLFFARVESWVNARWGLNS